MVFHLWIVSNLDRFRQRFFFTLLNLNSPNKSRVLDGSLVSFTWSWPLTRRGTTFWVSKHVSHCQSSELESKIGFCSVINSADGEVTFHSAHNLLLPSLLLLSLYLMPRVLLRLYFFLFISCLLTFLFWSLVILSRLFFSTLSFKGITPAFASCFFPIKYFPLASNEDISSILWKVPRAWFYSFVSVAIMVHSDH